MRGYTSVKGFCYLIQLNERDRLHMLKKICKSLIKIVTF